MSRGLGRLDRPTWSLVALAPDDAQDFSPEGSGDANRMQRHPRDPGLIIEEREQDVLRADHTLAILPGEL
jgi:hypothetical protein